MLAVMILAIFDQSCVRATAGLAIPWMVKYAGRLWFPGLCSLLARACLRATSTKLPSSGTKPVDVSLAAAGFVVCGFMLSAVEDSWVESFAFLWLSQAS